MNSLTNTDIESRVNAIIKKIEGLDREGARRIANKLTYQANLRKRDQRILRARLLDEAGDLRTSEERAGVSMKAREMVPSVPDISRTATRLAVVNGLDIATHRDAVWAALQAGDRRLGRNLSPAAMAEHLDKWVDAERAAGYALLAIVAESVLTQDERRALTEAWGDVSA